MQVQFDSDGNTKDVMRLPLGVRVRDIELLPDGSLYVAVDAREGMILHLRLL